MLLSQGFPSMTSKALLESKTSKLWVTCVSATSTMPVHLPSNTILWLSVTLRITSDGSNGVSRSLCLFHFDVHSILSMVLPSITACICTFSPCGPRRCTHLRYVFAFGQSVAFACLFIASRRPVTGRAYWLT